MLFVYNVLPHMRERIPAVTHIDGTARVQTVAQETHPRYHQLLTHFQQLRGVPILLNTSFNIMGQPIVHTPQEALHCHQTTGIDTLALGPYLISKN